METEGTTLIIKQQNISREITADQYRALLLHLGDTTPPAIVSANSGERARRGSDGLLRDVWPALNWGMAHIALLGQRLRDIEHGEFYSTSRGLALRFLPVGTQIEPALYVVMGGRAGAAALDRGEIYYDVLATSYRAATVHGMQYPSPAEINEFYAHEMHHLGLAPLIDSTRRKLTLDPQQQLAYNFLSFLVLEGSASYLINGHRDIAAMRADPLFASYMKNSASLLQTCERVLNGILHDGWHGETYERAQEPLGGMGWHAVGALMLAAIDRAGGLDAVMPVLSDPRRLFAAYGATGGSPQVDSSLAQALLAIGQ